MFISSDRRLFRFVCITHKIWAQRFVNTRQNLIKMTNGMQSNPAKFQSISLGKTPQCNVAVDDVFIQSVPFIRLLGVSIDSDLKFNNHVSNICQKAGRNLNALKRVAKTLPTNVKLMLYKTYISSHLNFCPLVWHFCGESNTQKLERIQNRALRFVFDDHESDPRPSANIPSLELSRMHTSLATSIHVKAFYRAGQGPTQYQKY